MKLLLNRNDILSRVEALAGYIAEDVSEEWLYVPLLMGALPFASDLAQALYKKDRDLVMDSLWLSSYGEKQEPGGKINILADMVRSPEGRRILLVDDVYDSGATLKMAKAYLLNKGALQIATCTFAAKFDEKPNQLDYFAYHAPDAFLVGYGMDNKGKMRGCDSLYAL